MGNFRTPITFSAIMKPWNERCGCPEFFVAKFCGCPEFCVAKFCGCPEFCVAEFCGCPEFSGMRDVGVLNFAISRVTGHIAPFAARMLRLTNQIYFPYQITTDCLALHAD